MTKAETTDKLDPKIMKTALILVLGAFVPSLDSTMVNVAVHAIQTDLHAALSSIQWVITGYILVMAVTVPFSGWAVKRFGGKAVHIFSLALFLAGSVLSSVSWNIGALIGFRILQAVGGGLMLPTMQTMLVNAAGKNNLGKVMSLVGVIAVVCPVLGPVFGGVIVNSLGWRWIFYVNIPVSIAAIILAVWGLPREPKEERANKEPVDIIGIALLSPSFAALLYGISQVKANGISASVIVPLIIGFALTAGFIVYALNTKKTPVIDLRMFKSKNFSLSVLLLSVSGIISSGVMLLLPLYYQQVRGDSALVTGLWLIPQGAGMLLTRGTAGKLSDKIGARPVTLACLALTLFGTLPFVFSAPDTNLILLAGALVLRGAGLGGISIAVMVSAYAELKKEQVSDASIATRILQTVGGAFGTAVLATVVNHQLSRFAAPTVADISAAYDTAFMWVAVITAVAWVAAFMLPGKQKT